MTDRELLEAAAEAAGIDGKWDAAHQALTIPRDELASRHRCRRQQDRRAWNPLTEDDLAFQLAVRLNMQVDVARETGTVHAGTGRGEALESCTADGDWCAATRRAIVRAAAALVDD